VSFVLNERKDVAPATRARILQAIEELGYRPNAIARNLATKRAGAIGIVCDMETYQDPLDMQFLAATLTVASEMEQRVVLIPADERRILEVAKDRAVDGIIFLDESVSDPRIEHLRAMGIPARGLWEDHLEADLRQGLEELALHLESRGIQQVVCLCGPRDKLFVTKFKQYLADTLQESSIAGTFYHCPPDSAAEVAAVIAHELERNNTLAIVTSSDKLAIEAVHALHAARLHVPDDCAVTGFGDVPAAQWLQPPLTTIRVPVKEMALRTVGKVVQEGEANRRQTTPKVGDYRLIVRRSC